MKIAIIFWDVEPNGVVEDYRISEELIASIFMAKE
jgi:hypothetical protein